MIYIAAVSAVGKDKSTEGFLDGKKISYGNFQVILCLECKREI